VEASGRLCASGQSHALASYGLSLEDLRIALGKPTLTKPKVLLTASHQAYTIGANDQLRSSNSYRPLSLPTAMARRTADCVATVIDGGGKRQQAAWAI